MNYKLWLPIALVAGTLTSTAYISSLAGTTNTHLAPKANVSAKAAAQQKKIVCIYLVYNGLGPEKDLGSYTQQLTAPEACGGHDIICYWRICDDDGNITPAEFDAAFELVDTTDTGLDLLSDEPETLGELENSR